MHQIFSAEKSVFTMETILSEHAPTKPAALVYFLKYAIDFLFPSHQLTIMEVFACNIKSHSVTNALLSH